MLIYCRINYSLGEWDSGLPVYTCSCVRNRGQHLINLSDSKFLPWS